MVLEIIHFPIETPLTAEKNKLALPQVLKASATVKKNSLKSF